jgi:hypothetical protein
MHFSKAAIALLFSATALAAPAPNSLDARAALPAGCKPLSKTEN